MTLDNCPPSETEALRQRVAELEGELEVLLRARRYALHALEALLGYVDNDDGGWDFAVNAYEALDTVVAEAGKEATKPPRSSDEASS
jgi:hypothetical protein